MAILLRGLFPLSDPPWQIPVGVVWHDEGAWTHNARNMALFGTWETDRWNPMYLAPVFNALEYASFRLFGVGLWQARLVSEALGFASVLLVAGAVRQAAGRTAGAMAGALTATNFVWVMWNRAALLETTMVVPMAAALYAYARAERAAGLRAAAWGASASAFAVAAFFAKAAAAFFPVAIVLVAAAGLRDVWRTRDRDGGTPVALNAHTGVILGLAVSAVVAAAVFVIPYWTEFTFYNWQMSVTRKPSYTLEAFVDRASWLPGRPRLLHAAVDAAAARARRPVQRAGALAPDDRGGAPVGGLDPRRLRGAGRARRRQRAALRVPRASAHRARRDRAGPGPPPAGSGGGSPSGRGVSSRPVR